MTGIIRSAGGVGKMMMFLTLMILKESKFERERTLSHSLTEAK